MFSGELFFDLKRPAEPPGALLIHLSTRSDPVDCHVDEFLRLNDAHDLVKVLEDVIEHLDVGLGLGLTRRTRARVNDAVHVEVEGVKQWVVRFYLLLDLSLDKDPCIRRIEIFLIQVDFIRIPCGLLLMIFTEFFI